MSNTKEYYHDQIEAGQRGKLHKISWLNMPGYKPETWNPVIGCTKVSPGCDNCYAERMAFRIANMQLKNHGKNGYHYSEVSKLTSIGWTGETRLVKEVLDKPSTWKTPRMVFVCSMSDLFHESVFSGMFQMVLDRISRYRQHIFILLTKRPENVMPLMKQVGWGLPFPPNVWLGVTAENQEQANRRIPILLQIPAAKRFVSIEPMLGPLKFKFCEGIELQYDYLTGKAFSSGEEYTDGSKLDWVICGGESGPKARPMHPDWVRSLRDQCKKAGTPFFFKQWGEWGTSWIDFTTGKSTFKMYDTYQRFTQKDWVRKGDACISLDGKICKTGSDMQQAQYPVAIMQKVGRKVAGDLLDGKEWHEWPKLETLNLKPETYQSCK